MLARAVVTFRARNPQVRRAGVEVNGELLSGGSDGNRTRPELLLLVSEGLRAISTLLETLRDWLEVLDGEALGKGTKVSLEVAQVPLVFAVIVAVRERRNSEVVRDSLVHTNVLQGSLVAVEGTVRASK